MKTYKSELFGQIRAPETIEEILTSALDPSPDDYRAVRMWRGQANIDWPIHSTAYRRLLDASFLFGGKKPNEIDVQRYEKQLLQLADHKGYRFEEGRRLSDFELLARLRHHGAATRLLDFSRSILIGLWFCVSSENSRTGLLVGIHAHYVGGYEGEPEEREYDDIIADLSDIEHPITWEPSPNSPRVAAQHSQFLYSRLVSEKHGTFQLPEKKAVTMYAINPKMKETIKKALIETFDIRNLTIFPDFDGFSFSKGVNVSPDEDFRW